MRVGGFVVRPSALKTFRASQTFWPLVALALIALLDLVFAPGFFKIGLQDGHLYGNVIDVLNDGAPLMLVAIGMTFVIATGGVEVRAVEQPAAVRMQLAATQEVVRGCLS